MSDLDRLQGYWRLASITYRGRPVGTSITHWQIVGDVQKEISPNLVETDTTKTTIRLDETESPKTIVFTTEFRSTEPSEAFRQCGFYELSDDRFCIRYGSVAGRCPANFEEEDGRLEVLERHVGSPPASKQPSGIVPLADPLLGVLPWDDNLNWYSGRLPAFGSIELSLSPSSEQDVSVALGRAHEVVPRLDRYASRAADFAVSNLLDLKNDSWLDEDEEAISAAELKSRMRLESITFDSDGSVTFYHHDGDLFWGHCIQIGMDDKDQFVFADIPG